MRIEIPLKLPSCNEYINACRYNKFAGAKMKKEIEEKLGLYIRILPKYQNAIKIHFHWVEGNKRRDLDNVCFAKKFILDCMVKCGKMKDDNRNHVVGFSDSFAYGDSHKVILEIEEAE